MGIECLLKQFFDGYSNKRKERKHLNEYSGMRAAVDGYCWLHKSVYAIRKKVLDHNPTFLDETALINTCMLYMARRVSQLQKYNIKPLIVFDGNRLPMKEVEEVSRER
jgi:exonuclease-1